MRRVAYLLLVSLLVSLSVAITVVAFFMCMHLHILTIFYCLFVVLMLAAALAARRGRRAPSSRQKEEQPHITVNPSPGERGRAAHSVLSACASLKVTPVTVALVVSVALLSYLAYPIVRTVTDHLFIDSYARELPQALKTGDLFDGFMRRTERVQSPTERFRINYTTVMAMWGEQPDQPGDDHFSNVEETLRGGMRGDCEDRAVLLVAIAKALGMDAVVILGQSQDGRGHAWAEVLVSKSPELSPDVTENIKREFANTAYIVRHGDEWWLVCSPEHSLDSFEPRWLIEPSGRILPVAAHSPRHGK